MLQNFSKYAGVIQGILGLAGTASGNLSATLGAAGGNSIFNLISGAVLGYLGFKGTESQQRTGAIGVGGLNALVGLLGAFGVTNLGITPDGTIGVIINLAVGAWGLISAFMKKKAAAA
jgi:hypothetical protein